VRLADVIRLTALEQAALIRKRHISSEELTRAYLERIDARNGELSAFVDIVHERAIGEARARDRGNVRGRSLPTFWGVPTAMKDLDFAKGTFTRFGSRAFENLYATFDGGTTKRMREGGFVILGKTSTSELGAMPCVETDIHPPTRNPWNLEHTSGGSSGGAGAAVAGGLLPIAPGSDGAGSIRIPSSYGGLFGIKPSRGRVPNAFGADDHKLIYTAGPIGRTVEDVAALLDVMAGITVEKPHWAPPPASPFAELCRRPPARLRVRFTTTTPLAPTHPEVDAAVREVVRLLASMGHEVDEGPMADGTVEEFLPVWQHQTAEAPIPDWSVLQPVTRWLADKGRNVTLEEVERRVDDLGGRVRAWFGDDVDVWVTPTVPRLIPKVNEWRDLPPDQAFAGAVGVGPFTAPFNVSGLPAASVPAAMSSSGLPIGVQIVGKPFADALVLAVSRALEDAIGWRARPLPFGE
jgi:amidase